MKRTFAALRFCEDENIAENVYWYLCELRVETGDRVLAPVGTHNRLQCARVERLVVCEEADAPYDVALIKRVAAKYGVRGVRLGGYVCREFGGLCYDGKCYTRFSEALYSDTPPSEEELRAFGAMGIDVLCAEELSEREFLQAVSKAAGCVLVFGAGATERMKTLFALLSGEKRTDVDGETLARLKKKFL